MDMLLATGEQQSAALLAMTLNNRGTPAVSLTGQRHTQYSHSKARIVSIANGRILQERQGNVVVIAGFQAFTPDLIATLGRGGSCHCVALAAGLSADRCIIFTDVDGVLLLTPYVLMPIICPWLAMRRCWRWPAWERW